MNRNLFNLTVGTGISFVIIFILIVVINFYRYDINRNREWDITCYQNGNIILNETLHNDGLGSWFDKDNRLIELHMDNCIRRKK